MAIMKGAVLYKLGLDLVRNRVIRVSYGTEQRLPFQEGRHPESRRIWDLDGYPKCEGVMHWFAKKVLILILSAKASGSKSCERNCAGERLLLRFPGNGKRCFEFD